MPYASRSAFLENRHSTMFKRLHHQAIAQVLHALDGNLLKKHDCLFGGGTVIAMRYGEYRESIDIDFMPVSITARSEVGRLITVASTVSAGLKSSKTSR